MKPDLSWSRASPILKRTAIKGDPRVWSVLSSAPHMQGGPFDLAPKLSKETSVSKNPEIQHSTVRAVMLMEFRLKYGGLIAFILVLIYSAASLYLIFSAFSPQKEFITPGIESVYTTVGALLSATVVAMFAITPPGEHPASQLRSGEYGETWSDLDWGFGQDMEVEAKEVRKQKIRESTDRVLRYVIDVYVGIWVIFGASALIVGVMILPGEVSVLTAAGNAWLGIAVASIYVYVGISEPGKKAERTPR